MVLDLGGILGPLCGYRWATEHALRWATLHTTSAIGGVAGPCSFALRQSHGYLRVSQYECESGVSALTMTSLTPQHPLLAECKRGFVCASERFNSLGTEEL